MESCKNLVGYVCRALIKYCLASCKVDSDDDSPIIPVSRNDCYCNCTNKENFNYYCYKDDSSYLQFAIASIILIGASGVCIIGGLCRYRIANIMSRKTQDPESQLQPPPYELYHIPRHTPPPPIYSAYLECEDDAEPNNQYQLG